MRRILFSSILVLSSLVSPGAEEPSLPPLRVMTRVAAESLAGNGAALDAERLSSSLDAALVRLPRVSSVRRLGPLENALEAAEAAGYDLIVEARVGAAVSPGLVRVERRITEAATGRVLEESAEEALSPTENELSQTFWLSLSAAVEKSAPAPRTVRKAAAEAASAPAPERSRRWITDAGMYMAQYPDFWSGASFLSDRLFVKAGFYQFRGGLYFGSASSDTSFKTVSFPLFQPGMTLGAYFAGPASALRPYLSLTAFARIAVDPLKFVPSAPFGTTLFLGLERRVVPGFAVFLEAGLAYYPFCDGYLTAVSKYSGTEGGYGFSYGETWFVEYPQIRLGVRVFL